LRGCERTERPRDRPRIRVQVERLPGSRRDVDVMAAERRGDPELDVVVNRPTNLDPAHVLANCEGATVAPACHSVDAESRAAVEERQHPVPVEGRPKRKSDDLAHASTISNNVVERTC